MKNYHFQKVISVVFLFPKQSFYLIFCFSISNSTHSGRLAEITDTHSRGQQRSTSQDENQGRDPKSLCQGSPWNNARLGHLKEGLINLRSYKLRRDSKYKVTKCLKICNTHRILNVLLLKGYILNFVLMNRNKVLFLARADPNFYFSLIIHSYFY